jgi:hypothetical protein
MKSDKDNTEEQLINELDSMRQQLAEFGESEADHKKGMEKELGNTNDAEEATNGIELKSAEIIAALAEEADQLILEAGKTARREAEREAERFLKEYKQKTKHIVLKIRKETNAKASEIANRVKYAIEQKIEEAFADAMTESSRKVEELAKDIQQITSEELGQASAEAKAATEVDLAAQEETAVANERKIEFAIEEGDIGIQETDQTPWRRLKKKLTSRPKKK